eukprot:678065_1
MLTITIISTLTFYYQLSHAIIGPNGQECVIGSSNACPYGEINNQFTSLIDSEIECEDPYECCLCKSITCGNTFERCDKFKAEATFSAFYVSPITINGDLSDGATIECSGNNACDGAQINGEYIKEFNSDEDRACGQFSLSYINDEGKLEYIYILSALSKPQKHLPIPCNVSRSKSLNVSTIHNTNTKRISHSGSYTSQNIMMFISNSTPSETPPHKPINLPYPITLSPPLTSQHSGSGQSYSSNNNSRSSFTITGSMKNGNDNFYAINNGRHMEQLTEFGH